jgi:hypothetical protein
MLVSNVYMLCMLSPLKLTQLVLNVSKSYTISLCDPGYLISHASLEILILIKHYLI